MKQVVQAVSGGPVRVVDVPRPTISPTEVLVRTRASIISPGTERAVTALARSSLLDKARARPDLVRQVMRKARVEGVAATARAVRSRLDDEIPLGYSAAGIAVEVGSAVEGIAPGALVATAGGGHANHAEFQAVPGLLCRVVPDGVPASDASFATVGAIALHALRLGGVDTGAKVLVVGLGLVGQLAMRLAAAAGAEAFGIDVRDFPVDHARGAGQRAEIDQGDDTTRALLDWTRQRGADVVIVAAAARSSAVMGRVPERCRDRADVVIVGDVGVELDRRPYYERELTVRFARSYGPGRYEPSYEDWAVDYPAGQVRWTEGRNLEAVLDLLGSGALRVADLVTHRYPIADASSAYALLESDDQPVLAVALDYTSDTTPEGPIVVNPPAGAGVSSGGVSSPGVGLVGAGAFARTILVPALREAGFERLVAVSSASGLSARRLAERSGFEQAVSGADAVIDDPAVGVVAIATPHGEHGRLTARALRAGKHVFCEKPLALDDSELADIEAALAEQPRVLFVGFNRRYSEPVRLVTEHLAAGGSGPVTITYRVNAGPVPEGHWYADRRHGGRLIGEVCHFIDTCAAIVGTAPTRVEAVGGGQPSDELLTAGDVAVLLGWPDGSVASITYAAGGPPTVDKERLEVLGRNRSALVEDYRSVVLDGHRTSFRAQDKGHRALVRAFHDAVRVYDTSANEHFLASSRATLQAAQALSGS
jgi:predicted dehydrogenase/threonine dehydrogenase-like Zn-dependent dehydrogenase